MAASRTCWPLGTRALLALLVLCVALLRAQPQPLAPTANLTIVVPAGPLHYSSIHIPAGVDVRFVAPTVGSMSVPGMPAVILCDGDAIVHGSLTLAYSLNNDRPAGWVHTGSGVAGGYCGSALVIVPGGGQHAGTYGSVLPFGLQGGSSGGIVVYRDSTCSQQLSFVFGGVGGGTLVLLAGGRIEVHGTVNANGSPGQSGGSGGSIMLRGDAGVAVLPGGSVTARGGPGILWLPPWPGQFSTGAPGYVRLDAWGTVPVIQGTVDPAPTVLELPYLRSQSPPTIGTTWILDVFAPDTAWVYVAASLAPGSVTTPFGSLGLDLGTTAGIALTVPQPGHDPVASVQWPIPNAPALVGFAMWIQAIAVPPNLPARLTNTLAVVVQ